MKKILAVAFLVFSMVFISCDQDFNTIGADLVGDEHFDFDKYELPGLKAYSVRTGEVQTNNLPFNPLGFYNNPFFGQTKANFVTQLALTEVKPKFGTSVEIENVVLYIPYYSKVTATDADGNSTYALDSIYGVDKESTMKLKVFENGYFLSGLDPSSDFQESQKYFSNSTTTSGSVDFEGSRIGSNGAGVPVPGGGTHLNNSANTAENDQFFFNKAEIIVYKTKLFAGVLKYVDANDAELADQTDSPTAIALRVIKERLAPGIYLTLDKAYFKNRIIDAPSLSFFSNNDFRQYFKGLYFKVEQNIGEDGAMAMINFNRGKLSVNYSSVDEGAVVGTAATSKTFAFNIGTDTRGTTVSLQDFNYSGAYDAGLTASQSNPTFGSDANLYLKGGKGSVVYMDLFENIDVFKVVNGELVSGTNDVPDDLDRLRLKGWLINDAYLEFFVDQTAMSGNTKSQEPERLYLFDATNQKPLLDYAFDSSTSSNFKRSKILFGGVVVRESNVIDENRKAIKYKIRITQHITSLLNNTNYNLTKNVRLGLCVTENIGLSSNAFFKNPLDLNNTPAITNDDAKFFPVSSIMAQQGVVLHGTNSADPDKKLKLVIHFTKPN